MNRPRIVSTAHVVLITLVGFALVYGLPMLGLDFAIDHGLYVDSAATVVPFLRGDRLERVVDVLDFHTHGTEQCATVVLEAVDGCPEMECCIPVAARLDEGVRSTHTLFTVNRENPFRDAAENDEVTSCGPKSPASISWMTSTNTDSGSYPTLGRYSQSRENPLTSQVVGINTLDGAA